MFEIKRTKNTHSGLIKKEYKCEDCSTYVTIGTSNWHEVCPRCGCYLPHIPSLCTEGKTRVFYHKEVFNMGDGCF